MKNITFSADEVLLKKARRRAHLAGVTLNEAFREWLQRFSAQEAGGAEYRTVMKGLQSVQPGRKLSREDMNAR